MEQTNNSANPPDNPFSIDSVDGNLRMDELESFWIEINPIIAEMDKCLAKHMVNEKCLSLRIKDGKVNTFMTHWEFCALRNAK